MKGININCKKQDFIQQILSVEKVIETRETPSLRPYINSRVGLVKTGKGKAMLCGYATIIGEICYTSVENFRNDYEWHRVAEGSDYDIKEIKYGYILDKVKAIEPIQINSRGIVVREVPEEKKEYSWYMNGHKFTIVE